MRALVGPSLIVCGAMYLSGCSRISSSSSELFKLRAECTNQAREFEADWRRKNGSDFQVVTFQNHYNQTRSSCFVHVYYGNPDNNIEAVYDALQSASKLPIVFLQRGNDKAANESKESLGLAARIRDYMEGDEDSQ
jgi:hypothetical protein